MERQLKILHVGYSDSYGGASIAMNRIHEAVSLSVNIDSKVAVVIKNSSDVNFFSLDDRFLEKVWSYLRARISYKIVGLLQKTNNLSGRSINIFPSSVINKINKFNADVVHLHWICNETIRIEDLPKIKAPVIWTFHDKWPLLGAEHTEILSNDSFIIGYDLKSTKKNNFGIDFDKWTWLRKKYIFEKCNIQPVVVSNWLAQETSKSYLWKSSNPIVINNPINIDEWTFIDKSTARKRIHLDEKKLVISFGAFNALNDELKGYRLLLEALKIISINLPQLDILCLIFGDNQNEIVYHRGNLKIQSLGKINSKSALNNIYAASNVTVIPSYVETFGQVALESICCGTPVACFKTSGLLDIIDDGINGSFAIPYNVEFLAKSIIIASNIKLDQNYVKVFSNGFSFKSIGEQYCNVYYQVIKK